LNVTIPTASIPEDRFTGGEIERWLNEMCGQRQSKGRVPIRLVRTGEVAALPAADERPGPGSRESYRISIRRDGVELKSPSSAGLFYAAQTLRDMLENSEGAPSLPVAEVEDWPAMSYRGFMMDMGHGAVPTEEEVKRQIDFLSRWKANQYYFYAETTIELKGYPLLENEATWSQESIHRIIDYARERHVDVVPCMELYAHLHDLFRVEQYADLSGVRHGGEINPRNPKVIAITEDWLQQLAALFPSPWFHLGMDEAWDLERTDPNVKQPAQFYLDQLRRLCALAVKLGKRPMFWADVIQGATLFQKYPELYTQMPKEVIAVPWYYTPLADFTPLVKPFADHGIAQVIAPGVDNWEELSTDFDQTFRNIDDFTAAGRRYGALGMMNTGWTDSAQNLYRTALPGMAYGAVAAWQEQAIPRAAFFPNYARIEYRRAGADVAEALAVMTDAIKLLRQALGDETMFRLWDDPLRPATLARVSPHLAQLHEARLQAEKARLALRRVRALQPDAAALPTLAVSVRIMDYAALRYIYAAEMADGFRRMPEKPTGEDVEFYLGRQASSRNHSPISDLMDEAAEIPRDYERAWLAEYRPYRLRTALGRWQAEFEYWRSLQARLWEMMREFERTGARPDLNQAKPSF
jgi:hypothetical protein